MFLQQFRWFVPLPSVTCTFQAGKGREDPHGLCEVPWLMHHCRVLVLARPHSYSSLFIVPALLPKAVPISDPFLVNSLPPSVPDFSLFDSGHCVIHSDRSDSPQIISDSFLLLFCFRGSMFYIYLSLFLLFSEANPFLLGQPNSPLRFFLSNGSRGT